MRSKLLLKKLERASRGKRRMRDLKAAFLSNIAQITARANGESPPPPHPAATDPRRSGDSFMVGTHKIVDYEKNEVSGVQDLSE